jgi:Ser/Thr protein kinase RdoA (MazF antagonist)
MGVKTKLSLTQAKELFSDFAITKLLPTQDGIMDTTYLASGKKSDYVIKKYERNIKEKILFDSKLLEKLHTAGLNVSLLLAQNEEWYLYKKLQGEQPKQVQLTYLRELGRFLATLHKETKNMHSREHFLAQYPRKKLLRESREVSFYYYKKLASLQGLTQKCEGFIHGDIFRDNVVIDGNRVGVFDFIDGGCGSFVFDLAVVNLSFNPHARRSFERILLSAYNQKSRKKIPLLALQKSTKDAAKLYALLRITKHKSTKRAKELAKLW